MCAALAVPILFPVPFRPSAVWAVYAWYGHLAGESDVGCRVFTAPGGREEKAAAQRRGAESRRLKPF